MNCFIWGRAADLDNTLERKNNDYSDTYTSELDFRMVRYYMDGNFPQSLFFLCKCLYKPAQLVKRSFTYQSKLNNSSSNLCLTSQPLNFYSFYF